MYHGLDPMNTSFRRALLKSLPAGLALSGPARAADGKVKMVLPQISC
jgi:hypothetical protein